MEGPTIVDLGHVIVTTRTLLSGKFILTVQLTRVLCVDVVVFQLLLRTVAPGWLQIVHL